MSLGIEKVVCNYEAEYFTSQHPHYWRKGIRTVKGREDPLSVISYHYSCTVVYKEQQHSSTEHAYQATELSFLGAPEEIVEIASNMETASGVKKYGQQILCSPSWQVPTYRCWDFKKIEVMKELLEVKWETSNAFIDYLNPALAIPSKICFGEMVQKI